MKKFCFGEKFDSKGCFILPFAEDLSDGLFSVGYITVTLCIVVGWKRSISRTYVSVTVLPCHWLSLLGVSRCKKPKVTFVHIINTNVP